MVSHTGKMPDADVVYSDVKFMKSKETGAVSWPTDSTYSDVKLSKTEPSTELPDSQQQAPPNGGSKVKAGRVAIAVLAVLLAAAGIFLVLTSYKYIEAMGQLQELTAVNKNLTERQCNVNPWRVVEVEVCTKPEPCPRCQTGWVLYERHCYNFSTVKKKWNEARNECKGQKGDLVKIDSVGEQVFLVKSLSKLMDNSEDKFWIGLTDSDEEGKMLWVDGSPLNQSLTFWSDKFGGVKEPDDFKGENPEGEDCVRMGELQRQECWFDKSCTSNQRWICEKSAENGKLVCM